MRWWHWSEAGPVPAVRCWQVVCDRQPACTTGPAEPKSLATLTATLSTRNASSAYLGQQPFQCRQSCPIISNSLRIPLQSAAGPVPESERGEGRGKRGEGIRRSEVGGRKSARFLPSPLFH